MSLDSTTIHSKHHDTFMQLISVQKGLLVNLSHTYTFKDEGPYAFRLEKRQLDKIVKYINKIISSPTRNHKTSLKVVCGDQKKRKLVVKSSNQMYQGMDVIVDDCTVSLDLENLILFSIRMQECHVHFTKRNDCTMYEEKVVLVSDQETTQFEFEMVNDRMHMVMIQRHFISGKTRGGVIHEFFPDIHDLMKLEHMLTKDHNRQDSETSFSTKLSDVMDIILRAEYYQDVLNIFILKKDVKQCHIQIGSGAELKLFEDYITNAIHKF